MKSNKEQQLAQDYQIFRCISGSKGYGMSTESSDTDIRGVFIAPPEYTLGCLKHIEQVEVPGEDTVIYELAKFVKLCASCNPNIIELLYTERDNILYCHPAFEKFRQNRHLFLSRKAKHTFSGYAMAQLKRIKGHNKYITNPQPERAPQLLDFAKLISVERGHVREVVDYISRLSLIKINATTFVGYDMSNVRGDVFFRPALSEDETSIQYHEDSTSTANYIRNTGKFVGTIIVQSDTYKIQHRMWKEYWSWKKNRNKVRSELEEKCGYDAKHASHLIRLLSMAREILRDGRVLVKRPDAQTLLDIRNGKYTYEEIVKWAEGIDAELEVLDKKSDLPYSADMEAINRLFMEVVYEYWTGHGEKILDNTTEWGYNP